MRFLDLKRQYEKRFAEIEEYKLYPRIWFKEDDYDKLSCYLEEALSKNVILTELDSILEWEYRDLDERFNRVIEEGANRLLKEYKMVPWWKRIFSKKS